MIYDEIADLLSEHAHLWLIGGEYRAPSAEDVAKTIDTHAARLYDETDGSLIEVGGLIIQRTGNHIDLYVHIGEKP